MGEEKSPIEEWRIYQKSKAGGLVDSINYPMSLIIGLPEGEKIPADEAVERKQKFLQRLEQLKKAADFKTVTQATLDEVRDKAETTDWENIREIQELIDFIHSLADDDS